MKSDPFTEKRLLHFLKEHRKSTAQLATLRDLEQNGFSKSLVEALIKKKLVEELYVTLTTGAVVKGYRVRV